MNEPRGFAGLTSLTSTLPDMPVFGVDTTVDPRPLAVQPTASRPEIANPQAAHHPPPPDTASRFWTPGRVWTAIGIAIVGLVVWSNTEGPTRRSSPSVPSYSSPPPPSYSAPSRQQPTAPVRPTPPPAETADSKPTIGSGLALSTAEIQYCLAQRVRVETMLQVMDSSKSHHVTNVNAHVEDFNARCSNYRYRERDLDAASRNVEARRAQLVAEARVQVASWR
jgi:hypothetical protein